MQRPALLGRAVQSLLPLSGRPSTPPSKHRQKRVGGRALPARAVQDTTGPLLLLGEVVVEWEEEERAGWATRLRFECVWEREESLRGGACCFMYVVIFARPLIEQVADPVKGLADLIYYPSLKQHKDPRVFKLLVSCTVI